MARWTPDIGGSRMRFMAFCRARERGPVAAVEGQQDHRELIEDEIGFPPHLGA